MRRALGRAVRAVLWRLGFALERRPAPDAPEPIPPDFSPKLRALIAEVRPFTLTSPERIAALHAAVTYLVAEDVPGAIVECGVWRGGSMLAAVHTLLDHGVTDRDLYLYDTFWIDMPPPGEHDRDIFGNTAEDLLADAHASGAYVNGTAPQVRKLLSDAGYPDARTRIIEGLVEQTIPAQAPDQIALCRLDTDFYESTKHELEHLVHRISVGGLLLIDDYGHFVGAQRAVDEYFAALGGGTLLQRIDFTGRLVLITPALHARALAAAQQAGSA